MKKLSTSLFTCLVVFYSTNLLIFSLLLMMSPFPLGVSASTPSIKWTQTQNIANSAVGLTNCRRLLDSSAIFCIKPFSGSVAYKLTPNPPTISATLAFMNAASSASCDLDEPNGNYVCVIKPAGSGVDFHLFATSNLAQQIKNIISSGAADSALHPAVAFSSDISGPRFYVANGYITYAKIIIVDPFLWTEVSTAWPSTVPASNPISVCASAKKVLVCFDQTPAQCVAYTVSGGTWSNYVLMDAGGNGAHGYSAWPGQLVCDQHGGTRAFGLFDATTTANLVYFDMEAGLAKTQSIYMSYSSSSVFGVQMTGYSNYLWFSQGTTANIITIVQIGTRTLTEIPPAAFDPDGQTLSGFGYGNPVLLPKADGTVSLVNFIQSDTTAYTYTVSGTLPFCEEMFPNLYTCNSPSLVLSNCYLDEQEFCPGGRTNLKTLKLTNVVVVNSQYFRSQGTFGPNIEWEFDNVKWEVNCGVAQTDWINIDQNAIESVSVIYRNVVSKCPAGNDHGLKVSSTTKRAIDFNLTIEDSDFQMFNSKASIWDISTPTAPGSKVTISNSSIWGTFQVDGCDLAIDIVDSLLTNNIDGVDFFSFKGTETPSITPLVGWKQCMINTNLQCNNSRIRSRDVTFDTESGSFNFDNCNFTGDTNAMGGWTWQSTLGEPRGEPVNPPMSTTTTTAGGPTGPPAVMPADKKPISFHLENSYAEDMVFSIKVANSYKFSATKSTFGGSITFYPYSVNGSTAQVGYDFVFEAKESTFRDGAGGNPATKFFFMTDTIKDCAPTWFNSNQILVEKNLTFNMTFDSCTIDTSNDDAIFWKEMSQVPCEFQGRMGIYLRDTWINKPIATQNILYNKASMTIKIDSPAIGAPDSQIVLANDIGSGTFLEGLEVYPANCGAPNGRPGVSIKCMDSGNKCQPFQVSKVRYIFDNSFDITATDTNGFLPCGTLACEWQQAGPGVSFKTINPVMLIQSGNKPSFNLHILSNGILDTAQIDIGDSQSPRADAIESFTFNVESGGQLRDTRIRIKSTIINNQNSFSGITLMPGSIWSRSTVEMSGDMNSLNTGMYTRNHALISVLINGATVYAGYNETAGLTWGAGGMIGDYTWAVSGIPNYAFNFTAWNNAQIITIANSLNDKMNAVFYYTKERSRKDSANWNIALNLLDGTTITGDLNSWIVLTDSSTDKTNVGAVDIMIDHATIDIETTDKSIYKGNVLFSGLTGVSSTIQFKDTVFTWKDSPTKTSIEQIRAVIASGSCPKFIDFWRTSVSFISSHVVRMRFAHCPFGNNDASMTINVLDKSNISFTLRNHTDTEAPPNENLLFVSFDKYDPLNDYSAAIVNLNTFATNVHFSTIRFEGAVMSYIFIDGSKFSRSTSPPPFNFNADLFNANVTFVGSPGSSYSSATVSDQTSFFQCQSVLRTSSKISVVDSTFHSEMYMMGRYTLFNLISGSNDPTAIFDVVMQGAHITAIESYSAGTQLFNLDANTDASRFFARVNTTTFTRKGQSNEADKISAFDFNALSNDTDIQLGPSLQIDMDLAGNTGRNTYTKIAGFTGCVNGPGIKVVGLVANLDASSTNVFSIDNDADPLPYRDCRFLFEDVQINVYINHSITAGAGQASIFGVEASDTKITISNCDFNLHTKSNFNSFFYIDSNAKNISVDVTNSRLNMKTVSLDTTDFVVLSATMKLDRGFNFYFGPGTIIKMHLQRSASLGFFYTYDPTSSGTASCNMLHNTDSRYKAVVTIDRVDMTVTQVSASAQPSFGTGLFIFQNVATPATSVIDIPAPCVELHLNDSVINTNADYPDNLPFTVVNGKQVNIGLIDIRNTMWKLPRLTKLLYVSTGDTYMFTNNTFHLQHVAQTTFQLTWLDCGNTDKSPKPNVCPYQTKLIKNSFNGLDLTWLAPVKGIDPAQAIPSGSQSFTLECNIIDGTEYIPDVNTWKNSYYFDPIFVVCPTTTTTTTGESTTTITTTASESTTITTTTTSESTTMTETTTVSAGGSTTTTDSPTTNGPPPAPTTPTTFLTTTANNTASTTISTLPFVASTTTSTVAAKTPVPAPLEAARNTEKGATASVTATTTSAAVLGGMPSPALVTLASRAGIVTRVVSCESSLDEPLPFYINPTGLELDIGSSKVRYHVGAIVAGMAITLGFGLVSLLFAVLHQMYHSGKHDETRSILGVQYKSLGAARFAGSLVFPLLFFLQPFVGSSLTIFIHGGVNGQVLAVVILLIVILMSYAFGKVLLDKEGFLATYRTKKDVEFSEKLAQHENAKRGIIVKEEEQSNLDRFGAWYENTVEGVKGDWYNVPREDEGLDFEMRAKIDVAKVKDDHEGHKYFLQRYGAAFDYYDSDHRWFLLLEIAACALLGVCDGLVESLGCEKVGYIIVAVFGLYVISVFVIRPYATRKDFIFCGLVTILNFIGALLTVLPAGTLDEETRDQNIISVSSGALFIGTIQAIEGLFADGLRWIAEKLSNDPEKKQQKDAQKSAATKMSSRDDNYNNGLEMNERPMMEVPMIQTDQTQQHQNYENEIGMSPRMVSNDIDDEL